MDPSLWWLTAKSSAQNDDLWLPLIYHLEDTTAVMTYLVRSWAAEAFYSEIGLTRKDTLGVARFLAFTHDLGKAVPTFTSRITRNLPDIRMTLQAHGLLFSEKYQNERDMKHAHAGAVLLRAMGVPDSVAAVVGSHHGVPETDSLLTALPREEMEENGQAYGLDHEAWGNAQRKIVQMALEKTGYAGTEELPELSEEAQMLLTGLLIMADWIASNTAFFPLIATDTLPEDYNTDRARLALEKLDFPGPYMVSDHWKFSDFFQERFGFSPNPIQEECIRRAETMQTPGLMILEAPMGTGKTEAALAMAEILMNRFDLGGIAFFLPSQATSNAMFERILQWLESQPDADSVAVELSHSNARLNHTFRSLREEYARTQEEEGDEEEDNLPQKTRICDFFEGRKTKLLANVVTGTVDQLLMAALIQKHVMLRQLGLMGKVIIVDECHAYDAYMNVYLDRILSWLSSYGIPVILLSATLPGKRRAELLAAYAGKKTPEIRLAEHLTDYPMISIAGSGFYQHRKVGEVQTCRIPYETEQREILLERRTEEEVYPEIADALEKGGCVGIILNTVRRVQKFAQVLKQKIPDAEVYIDHSYFLLPDRMEREKKIMEKTGKKSTPEERKNTVVLGTQVLEQSLDLDFDLLITDLCPMDLLMQRIGREHRHKRIRPESLQKAKCLILHADPDQLEEGAATIYGEYLLRRTAMCLPEKIFLPQDISNLVQLVFEEEGGKEQLPEEYSKYYLEQKEQEKNAGTHCLSRPSGDSIVGLLDRDPVQLSEVQAKAAVRDGEDTIEVIMVQADGEGFAVLLSGEKKGIRIDMSRAPSVQEADLLAEQRIKLPLRLSKFYDVDQTENTLIGQMKRFVPEWMMQPALEGELVLILDQNGDAQMDQKTSLHYDNRIGMQCREVEK